MSMRTRQNRRVAPTRCPRQLIDEALATSTLYVTEGRSNTNTVGLITGQQASPGNTTRVAADSAIGLMRPLL